MAKRKGGGIRGKVMGGKGSAMIGVVSQVLGGAFLLFALIGFGIAINQLDTAYTSSATYDQVGLTDIMGIWGMVLFLLFIGVGVSVIAAGAVVSFVKTIRGGFTEAFLSFAMGIVALVIALILNTILQSQLNTAQVTINATTNIANFPGLYAISRIFGMLIFMTLVSSGSSGIIAAGVGGFKNIRQGF